MAGTTKCTGPDCKGRKHRSNSFCKNCFGRLSPDIKERLTHALKIGAGMDVMQALKDARAFLEQSNEQRKKNDMAQDVEMVTVELDLLEEREASYKVTDGESDPGYNTPRWIFLAKSKVTRNEEGAFVMPLWMAQKNGLV